MNREVTSAEKIAILVSNSELDACILLNISINHARAILHQIGVTVAFGLSLLTSNISLLIETPPTPFRDLLLDILANAQTKIRRGMHVPYSHERYHRDRDTIKRIKHYTSIPDERLVHTHAGRTVDQVADHLGLTVPEVGDMYMSRGHYSWPGCLSDGQDAETATSTALLALPGIIDQFGHPLDTAAEILGITPDKLYYTFRVVGFRLWPTSIQLMQECAFQARRFRSPRISRLIHAQIEAFQLKMFPKCPYPVPAIETMPLPELFPEIQ